MGNRRTLITGGTRGIGRAIALRLARASHTLVLGYVHDDDAAAAVREEIQSLGAPCLVVKADLSTDAGIEHLFAAALDWAGGIDAVVNNAGATLKIGTLSSTPSAIVRQSIDINLTAAILVARRAVVELPRGGVLVNISSAAATTGSPGEYVHYAAAKAGVDALTKGLALESAAAGIRVVGVAPGTISTDIHAAAGDPDRPQRVARAHPMGRVGEAEEVAAVVEFVLSPAAGYVSGTTIRVAGGV